MNKKIVEIETTTFTPPTTINNNHRNYNKTPTATTITATIQTTDNKTPTTQQ